MVQAVNLEGEDHLRKVGNNGSGKPKDPDAMDVDTIRANLTRIPEEEKLRRMNDGLCFNCGQAGHLARKSRNPTNKGQQGNRGGRGGQYRQRDGYGGYSEGYHGQGQGGLGNFSANNSYQQHWLAQAAARGTWDSAPRRKAG